MEILLNFGKNEILHFVYERQGLNKDLRVSVAEVYFLF